MSRPLAVDGPIQVERNAWAAPSAVTVSQWAERHRWLPPWAPKPGRWSNAWAPYLVEVMDSIGDRSIPDVTLMWAAQAGKSEAILNALAHMIDTDPSPTLLVMATEQTVKDFVVDRWEPMLDHSPRLRSMRSDRKRDNKDTGILINGARVWIGWAGSAAVLASKPVRNLFLDEVEKMAASMAGGKEGDAVSLARDRTRNYWDAKRVTSSTPTNVHGLIWREWMASDQRRYHVPCPHCGKYQVLEWVRLQWRKDCSIDQVAADNLTWYLCVHCEKEIRPGARQGMLARGVWVPEGAHANEQGQVIGAQPSVHRGYQLSALYSPFVSWGTMAREWILAQAEVGRLMDFVHGWLGWIWEEQADSTKRGELDGRIGRHRQEIAPKGTVVLTAGVDLGLYEIHWVVRGWGIGEESWLVDYGRQPGDALGILERLLTQRVYKTEDGRSLRIGAIAWDSGYQTDKVYLAARRCPQIRPVKGSRRLAGIPLKPSPIDKLPNGQRLPHSIMLWHVDTTHYKDKLSRMIRAKEGEPGQFWICANPAPTYLEHLVSEHKVMQRQRTGHVDMVWTGRPGGGPNHWWDAEVYCAAAADMIGVYQLAVLPAEAIAAGPRPSSELPAAPELRGRRSARGGFGGRRKGRWIQ